MPRSTSKPIKDWTTLLSESLSTKEIKPTGDGWRDIHQIKESMGARMSVVRKLIMDSVEEGTVEVFHGRALDTSGRGFKKDWYRIIT